MDRSPSFGSMTCYYVALFRLAFASAPVLNNLNLATCHNSQARSTKSTRSYITTTSRCRSTISACKHMVSGSISLPSRGSFQLSLTVLYAIGHLVVFSLRRWASHIHTGFLVSCATLDTNRYDNYFVYGSITLFPPNFPVEFHYNYQVLMLVRTPEILLFRVWAVTRSLATT